MPEIKNKVGLVYCRVSTSLQAEEGLSMEAQETMCQREAEKDRVKIIEVVKDEGKSGGSLNRPGIKRVIQMITDKVINVVYVVASDRLARNLKDHIDLRELCARNNVQLKWLNGPACDGSATSIAFDNIGAVFNEWFRNTTKDKVISTMTEKALCGYYPSRAPVGYINIENPDPSAERMAKKILAPDPKMSPLVKKMFELFASEAYNVNALTELMYESGLRSKTGTKIGQSSMYMMLKNRIYIGEIHWRNVHLKNTKHQPLVEESTFQRVQTLISEGNKHACRNRKYDWLLKGVLRCYTHGCRYTAEWHCQKKLAYYHCTNRGGCGKYIEINKMETMVAEKFKDLEFSPDFIDLVVKKTKQIFYDRRQEYEVKKSVLVNLRTGFEGRRKTLEDKLFTKIISDEDFKRMRKEIGDELSTIDGRLIELEKSQNVNIDIAEEVLGLTKNIHNTYIKASPKLKRHLLLFFWDYFEVADGIIIKAIPGVLFRELIKLEKAFIKSQTPNKLNDFPSGQIKTILSAEQEVIITIFSDASYMNLMYSKLLYIKGVS